MPKIKYHFDHHTLTYKKYRVPLKTRLVKTLRFLGVTIAAAIVFNVVFTHYYATPKEETLKQERQELAFNFEMMHSQIEELESVLADIELRDDKLYRPIFDLHTIPNMIREAGYGGARQYEELRGYSSSDLMIETYTSLDKLSRKLYIQSKSFDTVTRLAKNKEKMIAAMPAIQPIALDDFARISDYFGYRRDPFNGTRRMHHGMDFTGPVGADIYATGDGVIEEAGFNLYGYGNRVIVNHGFGYKTIYAHLHEVKVKAGDKVRRGEVVGTLGNTGRSTGPHLHYEVRLNGEPKNPMHYYFNDISAEQYDLMVEVAAKSRRPMD
ncbi:MAG: M23 family metallopeptidase [Bacteroidales bacterium]